MQLVRQFLILSDVSKRFDRCAVATVGAFADGGPWKASWRRSAPQVRVAACRGRHAVHREDRLPVASDADRLSSLADGLSTVPRLASQRCLGARWQDAARTGTQGERSKCHAQRSHPRFAERQDGAKRGRRGYDAGKKIKGRKRHIAVDTEGNLLAVIVHSAGIQDRVAARAVLMRLFCHFDTITKVFVDGGYTGKLIGWAKAMFGYDVEVVKRNELHTFQVLPKRWIVERTLAWLGWSRRLSKDFELHHTSAETMIHIAFAHMLLKRQT